jgi:ABC-type branched-subunit amino acid transport system ATPase component
MLKNGGHIAEGTNKDLKTNERGKRAYLGIQGVLSVKKIG